MDKKHIAHKLSAGLRRALAVVMTLAMLCSMTSSHVFALNSDDMPPKYLCGHVHDESCGYVEGSPCTDVHTHDESCGYCEASDCTYVHNHDESCGYREGSPCTYTHTHDENCGYDHETGEGCTDAHVHDESCGYREASPCTDVHVHGESCGYVHTHDENCGYVEAMACSHTHSGECGYEPATPSTPCTHVCYILSFNDYIPGIAIDTYEAAVGAELEAITAALPASLPGMLACAEGLVDIPVGWSCPNYAGATGTYDFRAELANEHCEYAAVDDELTIDINESQLPFIAVTVSAADEPESTATPGPSYDARTVVDGTGAVSVTGPMPEDARLAVRALTEDELAAYVAAGVTVVFAYDIKIMTGGILDEATGEYTGEVEYQPSADSPVTVTISPPEPIESSIDVVHISKDAETGETSAKAVAAVTTETGAVEFAAEGFSIYIGTASPYTDISAHTELYWSGASFFTDAACTTGNEVKNSQGAEYATLPALLTDVPTSETALTIYMTAEYAVADTQTISCEQRPVTLKRYTGYTGALITVSAGGVLTLDDITLDGGAVWDSGTGSDNSGLPASEALISVVVGTLSTEAGTRIQNNASGGVNVSSGSFTMNGGTVCGNAAATGGGINNLGTFNFNGGEITGNTGTSYGGGIYTGGSFYMSGGRIASNNSTADDGTSGLFVNDGATAAILGGIIEDTVRSSGSTGSLTVSGGMIASLNNYKALTITGGSIVSIYNGGGGTITDGFNTPTRHVITLVDGTSSETAPVAANAAVTAVSVSGYGLNDVRTDADGKLYLWLPANAAATTVTVGGKTFYGTSVSGGEATFYSVISLIFVNGSLTTGNDDGTSPENAFRTYAQVAAATESPGNYTVVVCGLTGISAKREITSGVSITLTSVYGGTDYRATNGAMLRLTVADDMFVVRGSLILHDVTLDGSKATVTATGKSLVYVPGGSLTINSGAVLKDGTACGVYNSGTLTMNGGTLTGNDTGMLVSGGASTMRGGTISGNAAGVGVDSYGGSSFTLATGGSISIPDGVTLETGRSISAQAGFTPSYPIPVTLEASPTAGRAVVDYGSLTAAQAASELAKFTMTGVGQSLAQGTDPDSAKLVLHIAADIVYLNGQTGLDTNDGSTPALAVKTTQKAIELIGSSGGTVYVCGQVDITSSATLTGSNVAFRRYSQPTIHDGTVDEIETVADAWQASYTGILFDVKNSAALTLTDVTIDGHKEAITGTNTAHDAPAVAAGNTLVKVEMGGALNVQSGAALQNNSNSNYGGGVWVYGTLNMSGGAISGNVCANDGGGVNVTSTGRFNLTGGVISGNSTTSTSWQNGGGGVSASDCATFTMTGGEISGNHADNTTGGGVFLKGTRTRFDMSGGVITGNTAKEGGGVYSNPGTLTMTGGEFYGNSASADGGGAYIQRSDFYLSGGVINENTATGKGGGVHLTASNGNGSTMTMTGGEISSNTASGNGGGVYAWKGSIEVSGGSIGGNSAANGGGVFTDGDNLVAVTNYCTAIVTGGTISGGGSGIYPNTNSTLTFNGSPTIADTVYLLSGKHIAVTLPFTPAVPIPVTSAVTTAGTVIAKYDATAPAADCAKFRMTDAALSVAVGTDTTQLVIAAGGTVRYVTNDGTGDGSTPLVPCTLAAAYANLQATGGTVFIVSTVTMASGSTLSLSSTSNGSTTLAAGKHIDIVRYSKPTDDAYSSWPDSYTGVLFDVNGTLNLSNVVIDGHRYASSSTDSRLTCLGAASSDAMLIVRNTGILNIGDGTALQNNNNTGVGSGGAVRSGSVTNMTGGVITGNHSAKGSGVFMENGAFNLSGGGIGGNTGADGSGIYVEAASTLNLSGAPTVASDQAVYLGAADRKINVTAVYTGSPITVTGSSLIPGKTIAAYGVGLTPSLAQFRVLSSDVRTKASGQNVVLYTGATLTAAGEDVALGAGQSKSFTVALADYGITSGTLSITGVAASGITHASYRTVYQDRRSFGYTQSNSTFGLSVQKTGGAETDTCDGNIALGAVTAGDELTFKLYNANAITEDGLAGTFTVTLSDGTNSIPIEIYVNRRSGIQLTVAVPVSVSGTVDATGSFSFPGGYYTENSSDVPVSITDIAWEWNTTALGNNAASLFHDCSQLTATVSIGGSGTEYSFSSAEAHKALSGDGRIAAHNGIVPGRLSLGWALALGTGNSLSTYPGDGVQVSIATITYTIGVADTLAVS